MAIERCFGVFKCMWKVFRLAKYDALGTSRVFQACANVHNIIVDFRMDLEMYSEEEDTNAFNGAFGDHNICPVEMCDKEDKAAGEKQRQALIEKAGLREDLIIIRVPDGPRLERARARGAHLPTM